MFLKIINWNREHQNCLVNINVLRIPLKMSFGVYCKLHDKFPHSEFFWSVFSPSAGNTDQKISEYERSARSGSLEPIKRK